LILFVYLERFRRSSTLFIWLGFSYWGRYFGGFGKNDPQNVKNRNSHAGMALPYAKIASFEPLCVKLALSVKKKGRKAGRQEGMKEEKSAEVYISRMRGATPSGRIPTKLTICVLLTDLIKCAKFHR